MDITEIEKGMLVECKQGVGVILVIDAKTNAVLIEERESHQQFAADISELTGNPQ
ncbi:hypothetical protein L1D15_17200 [Vibrio sp. Isolate25]|uniref:hypothetical protein n=1 Tax=Vibrio TaxID=662 RepID=UPI001EFC46C9|nr:MULTISPECIES: hypothetical protein [Vibrio]MCG9598458.1 hypothetical protein [Vibrio sp. Isolate25]MCG9680583.1 hypothetical protein [Vibrio sp. Isolate24]MCG9684955.1 hypothetical protein [Vibrio sp. Isolate23]USD32228.1 hypothetical protein J8Z27_13520 [Vibrio sp. SCSIO 43186]USD45271.1 hypothetical protein J4N38_13910 [Vibrio sp. SCSIO 43145]